MTRSAVELLPELVAIPSVSGDEERIAAFAEELLRATGADVERRGASVLARVVRGHGPSLLLNSHLDTVPLGSGWTRDAYAARWEDGRLYGRGANDAKASVAALIAAFGACAQGKQPAGTVWLALTACEETTNAGMAEVLARTGLPDGAITGEPTGLEVVRAQAGLAIVVAEWSGRSCHAAHVARVEHENALLTAAEELAATAPFMLLEGEHVLLGKSTAVATVLKAGERSNVVPDKAEALIDARLSPRHTAADVLRLLGRLMPRAKLRVRSERLRPVETAEDHPLVQAALACAGKPRAKGSSTLSDMALLVGVPAVKVGPGETARSHTADEFVMREEVEAGQAYYTRLLPAALEALASGKVHA